MTRTLCTPTARRRPRCLAAALALSAGLLSGAPAALADGPVAMILAAPDRLAGLAFVEVHAGDGLTLRPDETLEALDYRRCEEVRITGGTVAVGAAGLRVDGGARRVLVPDACVDAFAREPSATAVDLSINLRASAPDVAEKGPAGEAVRVERVVVRFDPVLAEAYPSVLVGWAGRPPASGPTTAAHGIDLPDDLAGRHGATLEVVLLADDDPPRVLALEIGPEGRRPTRVVYVR